MRNTTSRLTTIGIAVLVTAGCQCDAEIERCGAEKWLKAVEAPTRTLPFPAGPEGDSRRILRIQHLDPRLGALARCRHEQERLEELLGLPRGLTAVAFCENGPRVAR